jgi:hypothetical protein
MVTVYEDEGIRKGIQKGRLENARNAAVLEALEVKFGDLPYPIKEKIHYCDDLRGLKQPLRNAILIDDIEKFSI